MGEGTVTGRAEVLAAGFLGVAGVAAAAASAHAGTDPRLLEVVSLMCLAHAPALLAIGLLGRGGALLHIAALLICVGVGLFSADLALRAFGHDRLFAMAAPTGGVATMAGWLAVAISAIVPSR